MTVPAPHLPNRSLAHLARVSQEYATAAEQYPTLATAAAEAEAEYKTAKARFMLTVKAEGPKVSVAEAEMRADADEDIARLFMLRETTKALANAHLERLRQLRMQCEVGRSFAASERDADRLTAPYTP